MDRETKQWIVDRAIWVVGLAIALLLAAPAVARERAVPTSDTWRGECGSCHVAYPPRFLPATSWRAIMASLDKHFGVDASVDASAARVIGTFLHDNAGRDPGAGAREPTLRITETAWFRHEHEEISPAVWRNPKVNSAANCGACHASAEAGTFSEHAVHVPR
jgi:hypothetical protein